MNFFAKIPRLDLSGWAPGMTWEGLLDIWHGAGLGGIVVPMSFHPSTQPGTGPSPALRTASDSRFREQLAALSRLAKERDLGIWVIFPLLNNPDFARQFAGEKPVHREGESFDFPSWFSPICPSSKIYQGYLRDQSFTSLEGLPIDVLVLDYVRFPYFWEGWGNMVDDDQWPPFCYCNHCIHAFQQETGKAVADASPHEWEEWQCHVVTALFERFSDRIKEHVHGGTQLGVQILPLMSAKKRRLRSEWVGQHLKSLEKTADFLSPLLYGRLLDWRSDDIISYLVGLTGHVKSPIVPSFQISHTRWDRREDAGYGLGSLAARLKPLGIDQATVFHARELLQSEKLQSLVEA